MPLVTQIGLPTIVRVKDGALDRLQGENAEPIDPLFHATGFWEAIASDPFRKSDNDSACHG